MATAAQRDIVRRHVEEAVAAGARVTTGGHPPGMGTFFQPTVLADVDQSMACMTEETFGPTLPVVKVADEDEAIRFANDSHYGLSATVWTRDNARGQRVARQLEAGAVNINDAMANGFHFALPMPGWKHSGIGARNGGADGLLKYCRAQAITRPRIPTQANEPLWIPYPTEVPRRAGPHACERSAGSAPDRHRSGRTPQMKCQAAVLRGVGKDWEIQEITLDPPRRVRCW